MSGKATWTILLGTLVACATVVVAIIGFAEANAPLGIVGVAATVAVIVAIVLVYRRIGDSGRSKFEEALTVDFSADDKGWYHASGLAIDKARQVVLLATSEGVQRYPLGQIAAVRYYATDSTPAFSGTSILSLILAIRAIFSVTHNATKAGLHVTAGGHTFRIIGVQPAEAERWKAHLGAAGA